MIRTTTTTTAAIVTKIFLVRILVLVAVLLLLPPLASAAQENGGGGGNDNIHVTNLYDILEPTLDHPDGLEVVLTYQIGNIHTEEEDIRIELYDQGCRDGNNDGNAPYLVDTENVLIPTWTLEGSSSSSSSSAATSTTTTLAGQSPPSSSSSSSSQDLELTISIDPEGIVDDTRIFDVDENVIRFCVRVVLFVDETIEVNYLETIVTIDIDLTDGFQVGETRTAPKERLDKRVMFSGEVDGYFCDPLNRRIDALPGYNLAFTQGSRIRVCVVPTEETRRSGLGLSHIWSFAYERSMVDVDDIIQPAVENGQEASNALSNVHCTPDLCVIETTLYARFFQTLSAIQGHGIAILQIDGDLQFGSERWERREQRQRQLRQQRRDQTIDPVPLDQLWNITNPEFQYDNTMDFQLNYQVSDAMRSENVGIDLYSKGCVVQGQNVNDMLGITYKRVTDAVSTGTGYGMQPIQLNVGLDPTTVMSERKVYIESTSGSFGQVQLCTRISLYSVPDGQQQQQQEPIEVNFWETPVIFNFNYQGPLVFELISLPTTSTDNPVDQLFSPGFNSSPSLITLSGETDGYGHEIYLIETGAGQDITDFVNEMTTTSSWTSSSSSSYSHAYYYYSGSRRLLIYYYLCAACISLAFFLF